MRASRQTRRALPMRDTWPQQGRPIVSVSTILKSRSIIYAARFLSRARFPARSTLRHTSSLDDLRTLVDDKPLPPPPTAPVQNRVLNGVATGVLVDFSVFVLLSRIVVMELWKFWYCVRVQRWAIKYYASLVTESHDRVHALIDSY